MNSSGENIYLSVVMSVFNEEKYVAAAIKSILSQTYPYFEFIIINDGSTDNSESVIKSFVDERIVYKKISKVNFSKALNEGIALAKYDYIARMDADDISIPDRLEKQVNYIKKNPGVNVLSCGYALFKNKKISHIKYLPEKNTEIKKELNYSSAVCHAGSVYSKRHIEKFGGYNENLDCLEDIDLWLRIREETVFHNLKEALYMIRLKENSMTSMEARKPKIFFRDIYFKNFNPQYFKSQNAAKAKYAVLLFKFSSVKDFREYSLREKILFFPEVFLLFLWSFLSSKNILEWLRWKAIGAGTILGEKKQNLEHIIKNIEA